MPARTPRSFGFSSPRSGTGLASRDEHYLIVVDEEAIDPSARQFDETSEPIARRALAEVEAIWAHREKVDPDQRVPLFQESLYRGNKHFIPANWRELAEVAPPGDAIGWPLVAGQAEDDAAHAP